MWVYRNIIPWQMDDFCILHICHNQIPILAHDTFFIVHVTSAL